MNGVIVVGGVPNPIGGVTTFIRRLIRSEKSVVMLFDLYPADSKSLPEEYLGKYIYSRFKILTLLQLFFHALMYKNQKVHFNFSTPRSLILLRFLPKRSAYWALTLHHGNLGGVKPWMMEVLLSKVNVVLPLSDPQYHWYAKYLNAEKIVRSSSYVPAGEPKGSQKLLDEINSYKDIYSRIIVCSGYPTNVYNHELAFELMRLRPDDLLICCLYGPGDLREKLVELSKGRNIIVKDSLDEESFNFFLKKADLYLRLNSEDSFGIAVADAINYGVRVVATDVCARYPGAFIVPVGQSVEELSVSLEKSFQRSVFQGRDVVRPKFEYSQVFK